MIAERDQPEVGAFGMFDVLGFKHRLATVPLRDLRDNVVGAVVSSALTAGLLVNRDFVQARFEKDHRLTWACFSDTIILWLPSGKRSASDTIESLVYASQLLLARCFWLQLPLRGAISYGECIVSSDPVYYLGEPVLEAHDYEQRQEWAGGVLAPSASAQLDPTSLRVVNHDVPLKGGRAAPWRWCFRPGAPARLRAIDWPFCSGGPRVKEVIDGSTRDGRTPNWAACFNNSTDRRVLAKQRATEAFFLERDRKVAGAGVMFGEDTSDISSWRANYDKRDA